MTSLKKIVKLSLLAAAFLPALSACGKKPEAAPAGPAGGPQTAEKPAEEQAPEAQQPPPEIPFPEITAPPAEYHQPAPPPDPFTGTARTEPPKPAEPPAPSDKPDANGSLLPPGLPRLEKN